LEIEPEGAPVLTEAALIHLSRGERNRAKEHLQKAVDVEPNYTPARFAMASLLVREGKVKEGMAEFETALRLNPLGHEGYYTMAVAYEEREMKKESIEAYKKVYEILYQENQLFPSSYGR